MKRIFCLSLIFAATLSNASHAQDVYVGAAVGRSYSSSLNFNDAGTQNDFSSKDKAMPLKIFVGYEANQNLGVELGYKNFGSATIDPVPGSGSTVTTRANAWYVAAKGSMSLAEDLSLFGKLGVTHMNTHFTGAGELRALSASTDKAGLYAAVGTAYQLTKNLALTLELESFGIAKEKNMKFNMNGLSAGIQYRF
ncbi:outer membrane beta-barrel protein [Undibacterium sp. Tian12W]|uniref:outer membrane beta-barrel protein n=1 Tax=Undibacterium sp. Tian12W TaxID=3413054 RepID=UPI003BF2C313